MLFPRSLKTIVVRAALLIGTFGASGCDADEVVAPDSDQPFLYLVIGEFTFDGFQNFGQHALLVTLGSPALPVGHRAAERFEMRRASDNALFGWQQLDGTSDIGGDPDLTLDRPNYLLPDTTSGALLGASDLRAGGTYTLYIETEGEIIEGQVTVPLNFSAEFIERDGRQVAVWPKVAGAGGYTIEFDMDNGSGRNAIVQTDTVAPLPEDLSSGGTLVISALDPNMYAYTAVDQLARSGIDNGYGVFGALTRTYLDFLQP
jgi:hypothetical protein